MRENMKKLDRLISLGVLYNMTGKKEHLQAVNDLAKEVATQMANTVEVLKEKNGRPTALMLNGIRYVYHPGTANTRQGKVKHGALSSN